MTTASKKNRIALGFVSYFICLSLLGFAIYRWSQPVSKSSELVTEIRTFNSSGAVVSYETLEGELSSPDLMAAENAEPEAPAAAAEESSGSESAPAVAEDNEWN